MNNVIIILFFILFLINLFIKNNENFSCISYGQLTRNPNLDKSIPYENKIKFSKDPFYNQTGDIDENAEYKEPEFSECKKCQPGEYVSMNGCLKCPINQISTQENQFFCDMCEEEEEYTHGAGGTECYKF